MRSKNRSRLKVFFKLSLWVSNLNFKPALRLRQRRIWTYTGKVMNHLRVRRGFEKYGFRAFIPTRVRGNKIRQKFKKVKKKR